MVDRWQEFEYLVPSTVVQWAGALEVGRKAKDSREQEGGFNLRLYHGATPKTESSCYYFWTPLNGYKPKDPDATKTLHKEIATTFNEDLEFLESQQACMAASLDQNLLIYKNNGLIRILCQLWRRIRDLAKLVTDSDIEKFICICDNFKSVL